MIIKPSAFLSFSLLFLTIISKGQELAITERGDSVVLYSNGTWDYQENFVKGSSEKEEIFVNPKPFTKPESSGKKINGSNQAYELWYNGNKWRRLPAGELNPDADIAMKYINGDLYAMLIYEEVEIQMENLIKIALDNAIGVAPDIKVADKEYREVNGNTMIWMRMDGTTQGMKMSYYSYYFSNKAGTYQFHVFSGQQLIDKYIDDVIELLNGFVANN
jgi:hypothetical protein